MSSELLRIEQLLCPVSAEQPAGADLRFSAEWRVLEEARRDDDGMDQGAWLAERKAANWTQVLEVSSRLLAEKSKDLRLAMFFVEAKVRTEGFRGLAEGLQFTGELLSSFWDRGLYPTAESLPGGKRDFEDRGRALAWLTDKLAVAISEIPITFAPSVESNYSFARYLSARKVGREKDYEKGTSERRKRFAAAKELGLCLELFDEAVRISEVVSYERLDEDLKLAITELANLRSLVDDRFAGTELAPGFTDAEAALTEIKVLVEIALRAKIPKMPSVVAVSADATQNVPNAAGPSPVFTVGRKGAIFSDDASAATDLGGSWAEAQALILSGQVDIGLARMGLLAQRETSGRNRFNRKLLLADVCLKNRPRLARTILEELAEQIEKYKLDEWETTEVVGGVWTRLYRIYADSSDTEKAAKLYSRLCRLDPWQTLSCSED